MEVLGLLRPTHDLQEQESIIKQHCDRIGLKHYLTVFNSTDELTFTVEHKALIFSSPSVLTAPELEAIKKYAEKNKKEIIFAE